MHVQRRYFAHKTNCFLTLLLLLSSSLLFLKISNVVIQSQAQNSSCILSVTERVCREKQTLN